MAGIYIHIPFCKSRCIYCGFYSTTLSNKTDDYVEALCREAEMRRTYINSPVETVYLGGGTPSLLSAKQLERLLVYINKVYNIASDAEITVECNPDDVTMDYAEALMHIGVNRVSMGAQTFSDERLRFIRRRHKAGDVSKAVGALRSVGIENISIDLMFGFSGETLAEWESDVDIALRLGVKHISAYSLMYEEGTPLYRLLESGRVNEVDENLSLAMYECLIDRMTAAGYEHYEISNFALPGFRSRHNSSYWQQKPYLGLGAAAHSYNLVSRQWNVSDVNRYITSINSGDIPYEIEQLDEPTRYNDLITTALRTSDGLSLDVVERGYGSDYVKYCLAQSADFLSAGQLELTSDNCLRLTRKGLFVSDMVMSDLMKV